MLTTSAVALLLLLEGATALGCEHGACNIHGLWPRCGKGMKCETVNKFLLLGCCVEETKAEGAACTAEDKCVEGTSCTKTDEYTPARCLRKMCAGKEMCKPKDGRWRREGLCLDDADDSCEEGNEECPGCVVQDPCYGVSCAGGACHVNKYGEARCYRDCKKRCGGTVWHGWKGKDDGNNHCNECECKDGSMVCPESQECEKRTPECLAKGDVCLGGPEEVDRKRDCPPGLVCDRSPVPCPPGVVSCPRSEDTRTCQESLICCLAIAGCDRDYESWPETCTERDFETRECVTEHVCCSTAVCRRTEYLPVCYKRNFCGGAQNIQCGKGTRCVDNPDDDCDPAKGGVGCKGCCVAYGAPLGGQPRPPSSGNNEDPIRGPF